LRFEGGPRPFKNLLPWGKKAPCYLKVKNSILVRSQSYCRRWSTTYLKYKSLLLSYCEQWKQLIVWQANHDVKVHKRLIGRKKLEHLEKVVNSKINEIKEKISAMK